VSSDGQREYLTGQVQRLTDYCGEHFAGQCPKVYSEVASGSNSDRVQLNRLIDAMLAGQVSTLVLEHEDRLSRGSYGIIARLAEKCGVKIVVTNNGDESGKRKTDSEELMEDIKSLFVLYNARQCGRRAGERARFIAPPGMRERVAALYGAGMSFREMKKTLPAEGWKCANTGKVVTDHMVYLVFKDVRAGLREKRGSDEVAPSHVRQFVAKHCAVGPAKNVYALPLYKTYVAFCQRAGVTALDTKAFAKALHAVGRFKYERQTTGRFRVFGLELRGNPRATRTFKAPVVL
jgi:predicted site-specific integrase-resolvase